MSNNELTLSKLHIKTVFQGLFVTFLWSTSWVLIKIGLKTDLPSITFAGLRYSLAFLCLLPFVLVNPIHRKTILDFSRATWSQLLLLGLVFYTLTQGAQFVSLAFLPAATLTLLLNFSPVIIALLSSRLNDEPPSMIQWGGIMLSTIGAICLLYTSDAADERSSVDRGGRRIIKKTNHADHHDSALPASHLTM